MTERKVRRTFTQVCLATEKNNVQNVPCILQGTFF